MFFLLEEYEKLLPIWKNRIDEYRLEEKRLYDKFKKDVMNEIGLTNHKKAEKIFLRTWNEKHANGYEEVFTYLKDLVDLII